MTIDPQTFNLWILPLLIFAARIIDVSIGTVRIIFVSKGMKILAPLLGFIEMIIWLLAVRSIILNVTNFACYFAFAAGFALGNYVGIVLEERFAVGMEVIRIITKKDATKLIQFLQSQGYGVTSVDAYGSTGKVNLIFMVVERKNHLKIIETINAFHPGAFFSVEDVRTVREGIFPPKTNRFLQFLKLGI